MSKLHSGNALLMAAIFCVVTAIASHAQTLTTIHNFDGTDGQAPLGLVQGTNGVLYGTAANGGIGCPGTVRSGCGVVYGITASGEFATIYKFCSVTNCPDGQQPNELTLGSNGNLYGTTLGGGIYNAACASSGLPGCGTLFQITPTGRLTTLYRFCSEKYCADGFDPQSAPPVFGANGNLYGTTFVGGHLEGDFCPYGCGTVFEFTTAGALTTLHEFCKGQCYDGGGPNGLTVGTDGALYGVSISNRNAEGGAVYRMSPGGNFTTLYQFCDVVDCASGSYPLPLVDGTDGNLYGTTFFGGGASQAGTFFSITPAGELTTLYDFCSLTNCVDGEFPSTVILGTDGNFYGTTSLGGANSAGTIFKITPAGQLTTLYNFCSQTGCADGQQVASLTQGTDGNFYGATSIGGTSNNCFSGCGTVFKFSTGLAPFVKANPTFGAPGNVVGILGNNLASTTSVSFNGVPATFKVISGTYLQAQVPSGATTGSITVTTSDGTRSSDVPFQVLP